MPKIRRDLLEYPEKCEECGRASPKEEWLPGIKSPGLSALMESGSVMRHKCEGCGNEMTIGLLEGDQLQ